MGVGVLQVADGAVEPDEAVLVALGYAFANRKFIWKERRGAVGERPNAALVGRWAYRTYDCVKANESPELSGLDLFITAGLNGQPHARTVASLLAVAPEVSEALTALPPAERGRGFWNLERDDLAHPASQASEAWPLWRAWSLLMGAPNIDVAVTHKTLHHKRPDMFPLLDRRTITAFDSSKTAWAEIHRDLTDNPVGWTYVEDRFEEEARRRDGARLTRLRLHDILLWTRLSGDYPAALAAGQKIRL